MAVHRPHDAQRNQDVSSWLRRRHASTPTSPSSTDRRKRIPRLPRRRAGLLLLLYAQPLVKVVTFPTSTIDDGNAGMTITFGQRPSDVPEPFASVLPAHLIARPNLRTGAGPDSPWLFPSTVAGRHLHPPIRS